MRIAFAVVFLVLIVALGACAIIARRSGKAIGGSVALLMTALIPPVIGNLIIVVSSDKSISGIGCYIYFLGMTLVMFALLRFTFDYCRLTWPRRWLKVLVYALLCIDVIQLLCNPIFGHAFDTEAVLVGGSDYYRVIPYAGQAFHRIVDYGIFIAVLVIFVVKSLTVARVYSERYSVLLLSMIAGGLWQTFYIFSRSPVDRSMLGFGIFGLLVFYFALYYRPMRLLDRMLAGIASEMPEALYFFDAAGRCIWANRPGIALAGIADGKFERAPEKLAALFGPFDRMDEGWSAREVPGEGDTVHYYVLEEHDVRDDRNRTIGAFLSIRDNTGDQLALQREKYSATHDSLTGLYNREHLYECVRETLRANPDTRYDAIFVNVKDFKVVNDIFGNEFGDRALRQIARWVADELSGDGVCGRLSGDTFGVCLPTGSFDSDRIERALSAFVVRDGSVEHPVLIHLGVYEIAEPDLNVSVMFDRAHMAISTIREAYRIHIAYYDDAMRDRVLWGQRISAQLPTALTDGQVRPYLQAIVDATGKVVGAEALVRWVYPDGKLLSPAEFIPIFEKNGMIAEVDRFMWRSACELLARWRAEGRDDLFLSVNISPRDFYFMDVAAVIQSIAREYAIDPAWLRLEITETVMMTDIEKRIGILNELKSVGFIIEMDDFGSGYSSLNMLKDMPVDVIKLDMKFLTRSDGDLRAQTIMHSVIRLSRDLGLTALTEGVETAEQYRMLADMGCKLFQGYYFARPIAVAEFEEKYLAAGGTGA